METNLRVAHICAILGDDWQRIRKENQEIGSKARLPVSFDRGHGKAAMDACTTGTRFTTLKDRKKEIGPGLLKAMLDQLGLSKGDLEE